MKSKPLKKKKDNLKQKTQVGINPIFLVAIGASAGGLEALEKLIRTIPKNDFLSYVIIQHLDPHKPSLMDTILAKYTNLTVKLIENDDRLKKNTIFLNPADKYVILQNGRFILEDYQETQPLHFSIDHFLCSAAIEKGEHAIAVILSGTGTDGTIGINSIKANGGLVIAQSTEQAKYDGMPQSAINSGLVDFILDAEKMIDEILLYVTHPIIMLDEKKTDDEELQINYSQLFSIIRAKTGNDFSNYKLTTIKRRIARRMMASKIVKVRDYLRFLKNDATESFKLSKEFLITVTSFFRDTESFAVLENIIIPTLIKNTKGKDTKIRIWVPGCATGEEAYSIAMLMFEVFQNQSIEPNFQIFATDLDSESIQFARQGLYAETISNKLSANRLKRFFTSEGSYYKIKKELRETVIFAEHNLIKDPPFSKLDMICCRNVMIYLDQHLQKKIIRLFHLILNKNGILFLGPSESIGEYGNLFKTINAKNKIFQKSSGTINKLSAFEEIDFKNYSMRSNQTKDVKMAKPNSLKELTESIILEAFSFPGVIIDRNFNVLYFHGSADKYLSPPTGEANFNIIKMIKNITLRNKLNSALLKMLKVSEEITLDKIALLEKNTSVMLKVILKPLNLPQAENLLALVIFQEENILPVLPGKGKKSSKNSAELNNLALELQSAKESLQSTIEELEASNEELKSTNEELQSTNEELQSTNEELETSKEELQSTNEELTTTNSELQNKIDELSRANDDINNLLSSTEIETIFLDNNLRIKRFTPAMKKIYNLIQSDVDRPISDITSNINYENIFEDCKEVLDTLIRKEKEILNKNNKWYSVRILPYRTTENIIDGVVLTFIDISALKQTEKLKQFEILVNDSNDAVILFGLDGIINTWNKGAELLYGYDTNKAVGLHLKKLMPGGNSEDTEEFIQSIIKKKYLKSFEAKRVTKDGKAIDVSVTATMLTDESGKILGIATTERDITEHITIKQKYEKLLAERKQKK